MDAERDEPPLDRRDEARRTARVVRRVLEVQGPIADVTGLPVRFGETDPADRLAAAWELGRFLIDDPTRPDAEIDAFAAEFLLPDEDVRRAVPPPPPPVEEGEDDPRPETVRAGLVGLAVRYRVPWSTVVASAWRLGLLSPDDAARLPLELPGVA